MASGNPVVEIVRDLYPATAFAPVSARAGGSTPAESLTHWAFDAGTDENVDFLCRLSEDYDGGGLTFTLPWMAASATTGNVRWGIAVRRLDTAEDIDTSHSYDFNETTAAAPGTSGYTAYPTITFTNGADMDNWAVGELAIVRVRRNADDAADTMTGDAQLLDLTGKET